MSTPASVSFLARHRITLVLALGLLAGLFVVARGCRHHQASPVANLSDAEFRYGIAPTRNSNVVYQDDVVMVGGGAEAVRSLSSDGMTWTINARAPRAQELKPGSIMFLTSRAVGRVLKLERNHDELTLMLGPVELTDVIKEAHIRIDEPIDSKSIVAYYAPNYRGAVFDPRIPDKTSRTGSPVGLRPVSLEPSALALQPWASSLPVLAQTVSQPGPSSAMPAPVTAANVPDLIDEGFKSHTICCGDLGLRLIYDRNGVYILAKVALLFDSPRVIGKLNITPGGVTDANLEITGGAGLEWYFQAGSIGGVDANVYQNYWVPVDFSAVSIAKNLGIPLVPTFQFGFMVRTGFSSRNSTLHASGRYKFNGSIKAGYLNGSWTASAPTTLTVEQSMLDSVGGASISAAGLMMDFKVRFIVGFGAYGFVAGPYINYVTGISITHSVVMPYCRGATFTGELHVGIGYSLPKPVVAFLNLFLRALKVPEISAIGGADFHRFPLWHKFGDFPANCAYSSNPPPP